MIFQRRLFFVSIILLLTACGSGDGGSSSSPDTEGNATSTGLPSDINGLIVLNVEGDNGKGYTEGSYMIDLDKGQVKKHRLLTDISNGYNPYAHDRQTITYAEPCRSNDTRLKIINEQRLSSTEIVPCGSESINGRAVFLAAKISPDKGKIAIEVDNGRGNGSASATRYLLIVYDRNTGEKLFYYKGYDSPEWLPDGRLLMSSSSTNDNKGIFIASKDFRTVSRIDQGVINNVTYFLNVSPSGDRLIFTMSGTVWMMNIDSNHALSNLQELIHIDGGIQSPVWSPEGKYIAYLSYSGSGRNFMGAGRSARKITFLNVSSGKSYTLDTKTILPHEGRVFLPRPGAYMSWVR